MTRLQAMAKRCRDVGGECPCISRLSCQARDAIRKERASIEDDRRELTRRERECDRLNEWLDKKPATVREDWERPEKPEGDYRLCVHQDIDEWNPGWYSETEDDDWIDIASDAAWPFVEDAAWADDWERLGFEVV